MQVVITALLNKTVNEKLKEYKEIKVIMNDIQYQEGIIEALEINKDIDVLILSELLPGQLNIKELIEEIKKINNKIKIIIFLEKENKNLENYLYAKGNINIFYNNEIEIKDIIELIINKSEKEKLEQEIKELKKIVMNNEEKEINYTYKNAQENKNNKLIITDEEIKNIEKEIEEEYLNNTFLNKMKNKFNNLFKNKNNKNSEIILISGTSGVGKSIFTVNIAKTFAKKKKSILIIDMDFYTNSIEILFGVKNKKIKIENYNQENEQNNFENIILKVNSKINLISKINTIFPENNIEEITLLKQLENLKEKYDYIIIDTESQSENYLQIILDKCDKIIFLTEPNLLQIKKAKNILDKYINEWQIEKEKIFILFNKVKKDTICFNILKEVFSNYNIIGKINFIKNCNTLINQNMKSIFIENKIKKQYEKIAHRISINKKLKNYYLEKIKRDI